jgi:hypothetical protein
MVHQEANARIGRRAGVDRSRDAIEHRQRQAVATVRHRAARHTQRRTSPRSPWFAHDSPLEESGFELSVPS